ncbi:extracellular solute-binding protein [Arthrobacter tecti]
MGRFRGLTWDHPRGREALERSAAAFPGLISWDTHSLEGFESAPIDELAQRYDVIVLDHPHLGDAIATSSLRPVSEVFNAAYLTALADASVGPSLASYRMDDAVWALPLDAATQVSVRDPERVAYSPDTWAEVLQLSRELPVALSLAGPHAFLSVASICVALGEEPRDQPGAGFLPPCAEQAIWALAEVCRRSPAGTDTLNPIGLLERMRVERDIAFIPLIYGYVNYSTGPSPLRFGDAPAWVAGGRRGSTIGGTGLAISRRAQIDDELLTYLRWHLDPSTQATFIPANAGQPSARSAWTNEAVNAEAHGFYRNTLTTIDDAWVRPRVPGFTAFQGEASGALREAILGRAEAAAVVVEINARFDALAENYAFQGRNHG